MSVDVSIKNKRLFKNLKFEDIIFEDMRYGIMDEVYRLDENKTGEYTVVFNAKSICRGYEISLKKDLVELRMPLPTSEEDIRFFYEYIGRLCKVMNTNKFVKDGETASLDKVDIYVEECISTSELALKTFGDKIRKEYTSIYIFGAVTPISIGVKEVEEINGDLTKFGELMNRLQTMDVYYAKAKAYKRENDTIFGVYVLVEDVPSVLPYKPHLFMASSDIKVNDWNISFVIDEGVAGSISYDEFLSNTKPDSEYDAEHFIIKLDKQTMTELLNKYKSEL